VTGECKATGPGARIEVVGGSVLVVPGKGNNTICVAYDTPPGAVTAYSITEDNVTEYASTTVAGSALYISLLSGTRSVVVGYEIADNAVRDVGPYSVTGYRLLGLASDGAALLRTRARWGLRARYGFEGAEAATRGAPICAARPGRQAGILQWLLVLRA